MTQSHQQSTTRISDLVDLDRYPIDAPGSDAYLSAVADARRGLRAVGCAVIKDLVKPDAVHRLNEEIIERKPTTHFSTEVIAGELHSVTNSQDGDT